MICLSIIKSKRYIKKIALVGDSAVGKTSLIRRFVIDVFEDKYIATIGAKVSKKDIEYRLPDKTVYLTLMIWDILGQKDYKKMRVQGLTGSHGVIIACDLSRPETIKSAEQFWFPEAYEVCPAASGILVGNKVDIADPNSSKTVEDAASRMEVPFAICSARTGNNVESLFRRIGELMLSSELAAEKPGQGPSEETLAEALDEVVTDFCEQYGDTSKAMEIIEREFTKAGVNMVGPTKESLLMAIEYLSDIERDIHGRDVSEVNKLRRWKMIDEAT